jgi:thiol-disulfide isomerase/thioredoxin
VAQQSRAEMRAKERERAIAAARAAQQRAARRRRLGVAAGTVGLVLVVIAALVGLKVAGGGKTTKAADKGSPAVPASPAVTSAIARVPAASFASVGPGAATSFPTAVKKVTPLTSGGKPKVLYVGAEYCPYCAAERWAVAVALSRFGTLSGLGETRSASNDSFPNTPTLSFHGARLASDLISFAGFEVTTNQPKGQGFQPLDTVDATDQKVTDTYDTAPYISGQPGSIPFLDIAGRYVQAGSQYSPQLLAGLTQEQVAADLADPSNPVAKAIDGAANSLVAAICTATGGKPVAVCSAAGTKAASVKLGAPK